MNDCLWYSMMVCDCPCMCNKYLSMNSDEGNKLREEYQDLIDEAIEPLAKKFAFDNGFDVDA